jgi:hypothetical protein
VLKKKHVNSPFLPANIPYIHLQTISIQFSMILLQLYLGLSYIAVFLTPFFVTSSDPWDDLPSARFKLATEVNIDIPNSSLARASGEDKPTTYFWVLYGCHTWKIIN